MKNYFVIVSNQRCGSTWITTSLGNCENTQTDLEIKWAKDILVNKQGAHQLFLKNNSFFNVFKTFETNKPFCGTKFVFDFYKLFPLEDCDNFLNKFKDIKVLHITRSYIDIMRSKLMGGVSHSIDKNNYNSNRKIDNWINSQTRYKSASKAAQKNTKYIKFNESNIYLMNLFVNDILAAGLNNVTNYLNLNYSNIDENLDKVSEFLNLDLPNAYLRKIFIENPTIKKNQIDYKDNFENLEKLKENSEILNKKIENLVKNKFNIGDVLNYDKKTNKIIMNI